MTVASKVSTAPEVFIEEAALSAVLVGLVPKLAAWFLNEYQTTLVSGVPIFTHDECLRIAVFAPVVKELYQRRPKMETKEKVLDLEAEGIKFLKQWGVTSVFAGTGAFRLVSSRFVVLHDEINDETHEQNV